ncbi:MAG TPA: PEP-CTERM sorting domain-containing protein [Albitalea sp.]|nr:PEP-CTERM sorting domain-containing protein [Albitalea sp.]
MHRKLLALAALALASGASSAANVALGGTVSTTGTDFGNSGGWCCGSLAGLSTVTDGVFLPIGTQWNTGTVFWSTGSFGADTVTIDLAHTSVVSGITLEADNNDDYGISYRDTVGTWHSLATVSPHRSWGMDMGSATFAPVTATAFAITAVGGDGYFAVSEFQADGRVVPGVPEPETYALMLAGLGVVGWMARRRQR